MKVEPVGGASPWPYGPPGQLATPVVDQSFDDFLERLSRFSRDGLLDMGSRVLWHPWQHGIPPTHAPAEVITNCFGADVIGYAMMFCPPVAGLDAEEVDFRHLAWELHMLHASAPFESGAADDERGIVATRWAELLGGTPFGRLDAGEVASYVRGVWMRGRLLTAQLLSFSPFDEEAARVLLLHEALEEEAGTGGEAYRQFARVYFGDDVRHLLRHLLALPGRVMVDTKASPVCPGRYDVRADDESVVDVIDFTQLCKMACTPASVFPAMGVRLCELPDYARKLSPEGRRLALRPGILLDDITDRRAFSFPSPHRLVRSLHRLFVDDFIDSCEADAGFTARVGVPAASLLGRATDRHIAAAVRPDVLVIDDSDCPVKGKKPDAVWSGEHFGVVFEAKARVTPRGDPECSTPDSLLVTWSRCWEAVGQASEFLASSSAKPWLAKRTGREPDIWVLAIVVDEDLVGERTGFRHATARWDLLASTGLAGVAIVTVGCLERVVRQMSADEFGGWVECAWQASGQDLLDQPAEEPTLPSAGRPAYLEEAFKRLLSAD
jgi:hypothetical protein